MPLLSRLTRGSGIALLCASPLVSAQSFTAAERAAGVSRIWMEAHYNFVYFDQVPDLDWDLAHRLALESVLNIEDDRAYYRELQRFMAQLGDGHSNVYMPRELREQAGVSPLSIAPVDGQPVVYEVAEALNAMIEIGSVIESINGIDVQRYVDKEVLPFISASSPQHLANSALGWRLLEGTVGSEFELGLRSTDGTRSSVTVELQSRDAPGSQLPTQTEKEPYEFAIFDGEIAYLRIDTFGNGLALQAAVGPQLQSFLTAKGIVLDLRANGGGNSSVGAFIAGLFTKTPLQGSAWRTREHNAAQLAWSVGRQNEAARQLYASERGSWTEPQSRNFPANGQMYTSAPVVILTDWSTASAAEDLLVMLDPLEHITIVGRPTLGTTGQPLYFDLPGGGVGRVCAKRDTFPDGRDFVGLGIQPDVEVNMTVEELIGERDFTLERGIEVIRSAISESYSR